MQTNIKVLYPLLLLGFSSECYAYIDPGTGSLILQSLIAAVAVVLATGKMWWHKFTSMFSKKGDELGEDDD